MRVDRCICHDVSFADLHTLAQREPHTFDSLSKFSKCGTGCGMCKPYIQLMLNTGQTHFPPMQTITLERLIAESDATK